MKKAVILISIVLTFGIGSAFAQRGGGQHPEGTNNGQNEKRILKGLDLTKEQKEPIKQIRKDAKINNTAPETMREQI